MNSPLSRLVDKLGDLSRRGAVRGEVLPAAMIPAPAGLAPGPHPVQPARRPGMPGLKFLTQRPDVDPAALDVDREPARLNLAITGAAGNLTFTKGDVTAWFVLPEIQWAFRPDTERTVQLEQIAEQYAELAGYQLHLRRTTQPYDAQGWADALNRDAKWALPDEDTWAANLASTVQRIVDEGCTVGVTLLGVILPAPAARRDLAAVRAEAGKLAAVLGAKGLRAQPASEEDIAWMLVRSIILGLNPPTDVGKLNGPDSIMALSELAYRFRERFGSTVRVRDHHTGMERHVAVLTLGRMEELTIPEIHQPWLAWANALPGQVEISVRVSVAASAAQLERLLQLIRHQQRDYEMHGLDQPPELERSAAHALEAVDAMKTGRPVDACSVVGWFRLAVSADTQEECLAKAADVQRHFRQYQMDLVHPKDQYALVREFVPGEPRVNSGYVRFMPVRLFAMAVPQAASGVGDQHGDLIGFTAGGGGTVGDRAAGGTQAVHFDPNFAPEHDRSGLGLIVAEPGGGKSHLIGTIVANAVRRGVSTTVLDPSGPLARLAELPGMRKWTRVINLTGSKPGMLAPYALVPTPTREEFADTAKGERDYEVAVGMAKVERRGFVQDIALMLMREPFASERRSLIVLMQALREVPQVETSTLDEVVDRLSHAGRAGDVDAKTVAGLLEDASEIPLAQLFFGQPPARAWNGAPLTVITMAGLRFPNPGVERMYWTVEEQMSVPMLHAAAWLTVRRCYNPEQMHDRKMFVLDESWLLNQWASGRHLVTRAARDSRKWNLAGLLSSQNPADMATLDVENLVTTVFVGRIAKKPEIAKAALSLLGLPAGVGYEEKLAGLSTPVEVSPRGVEKSLPYREFLMRDFYDRIQRVRVDTTHQPDLMSVLNTTPGGHL